MQITFYIFFIAACWESRIEDHNTVQHTTYSTVYFNLMSHKNYKNINTDINDSNVPWNKKIVVFLLILRDQGRPVLVSEGPSRGLSRPGLGLGIGFERSRDLGLVLKNCRGIGLGREEMSGLHHFSTNVSLYKSEIDLCYFWNSWTNCGSITSGIVNRNDVAGAFGIRHIRRCFQCRYKLLRLKTFQLFSERHRKVTSGILMNIFVLNFFGKSVIL